MDAVDTDSYEGNILPAGAESDRKSNIFDIRSCSVCKLPRSDTFYRNLYQVVV